MLPACGPATVRHPEAVHDADCRGFRRPHAGQRAWGFAPFDVGHANRTVTVSSGWPRGWSASPLARAILIRGRSGGLSAWAASSRNRVGWAPAQGQDFDGRHAREARTAAGSPARRDDGGRAGGGGAEDVIQASARWRAGSQPLPGGARREWPPAAWSTGAARRPGTRLLEGGALPVARSSPPVRCLCGAGGRRRTCWGGGATCTLAGAGSGVLDPAPGCTVWRAGSRKQRHRASTAADDDVYEAPFGRRSAFPGSVSRSSIDGRRVRGTARVARSVLMGSPRSGRGEANGAGWAVRRQPAPRNEADVRGAPDARRTPPMPCRCGEIRCRRGSASARSC